MSVSRVIEVSFGGGSIAYAKVDTAYFYNNGILFKPTDIDLPASYQVHWADSPDKATTLETIGTAEGAPIPDDLWNRSRVIYGWIYLHPTNDSGITAYEVRIYKNVRAGLPDGTEPTPAEQSTIDQLIGALNSAVEQTGQDAESASQSAQSAESAKTAAESARDTAGEYANDAESSAASASTSASQASTSATASAESAEQAAQIKMDVEALADDAQGYAESASQSASASAQSASASANSATTAQGYANSASASAQSASGYASNAQTSANTASTKASEASTSAQTASQKATEAAQSATNASQSAQTAEQAKTASQTAQGLAESARDSAVQAKTDAESAKADAESARDEAQQAVASISGALAEKAPVITDTALGAIASFSDGADNLPLKSLIVDINPIQDLSHGDPSPENICPISGWDAVTVTATGGNLFNVRACTPFNKNVTLTFNDDGSLTCENRNNYSIIPTNSVVMNLPNGAYTISTDGTLSTNISFYASDDGVNYAWYANGLNESTKNRAVTINKPYVQLRWQVSANSTDTMPPIMFEYGSTYHSYEPYTGRSITIPLGQTVYGGKLDVLSGVVTVDRAMVDLGTFNWSYRNSNNRSIFETAITDRAYTPDNNKPINAVCTRYKPVSYNATWVNGNIASNGSGTTWISIVDNNYSDATTFKTAMSGVMLCYELATPIEIQLSPNQINSLLGVNNIWADSGDTEVEYRADTKLYIERLTAPDSADMIADANITSGQYFMVGNSLYKATANIANGSAIIVGTNAVRKSLSEALNEINA